MEASQYLDFHNQLSLAWRFMRVCLPLVEGQPMCCNLQDAALYNTRSITRRAELSTDRVGTFDREVLGDALQSRCGGPRIGSNCKLGRVDTVVDIGNVVVCTLCRNSYGYLKGKTGSARRVKGVCRDRMPRCQSNKNSEK